MKNFYDVAVRTCLPVGRQVLQSKDRSQIHFPPKIITKSAKESKPAGTAALVL